MTSKPDLRPSIIAAGLLLLFGGACSDGKSPIEPIVSQPGRIIVSVQASGGDPDDNGYEVLVGAAGFRRPVSLAGNSAFDFAAGTHTITLEGVAQNCTVTSGNPMVVTVSAGGITEVGFLVECASTGIEVTTRTIGSHFPSSHQLLVDNVPLASLVTNGSTVVGRLTPGTHVVTLSVMAASCAVTSAMPVTVVIANRTVTPVEFAISCGPPVRLESIAYTIVHTMLPQTYSIGLVKPDGTGAFELAVGHSPAWSPDGTRLVYSTTECGYDYYYNDYCTGGLAILDPETRVFSIPAGGAEALDPAWSPGGDVIAFARCCPVGGVGPGLNLLRLDGSGGGVAAQILMPAVFLAQHPAWSPDGQRIAFSCMVDADNFDICVVKPDGTGLLRLTTGPAEEAQPAWSPDGTAIAFTTSDGTTVRIAVMPATGGTVTMLTAGSDPAWSRDGRRLVFQRELYLFTSNSDGSNAAQLMPGLGNAPAWRP